MNDLIKGIVLKQQEYRENDLLIQVLCEEIGLVSLVVRGALKAQSKNRSLCMPYTHCTYGIDVQDGKTMYTLKNGHVIQSYPKVKQNLTSLAVCHVIAEITLALIVPNDPNESTYELLCFALGELQNGRNPHLVLALFIALILKEIGLEPNVDECVACASQMVTSIALNEGGFVCQECASQTAVLKADVNTLKAFRYINKASIENMEALDKSIVVKSEHVKIFMDFLMIHTGINLKSSQFYLDA